MGRMYAVSFEGVAVTATQDFFALLPATQKPLALHSLFLSQASDVGDAAEELLRVKVIRGHTTVGSGGGTFTPTPLSPIDTAAGATARINDTTIASAGTAVDVHAEAFNIRTGLALVWPPELRPIAKNAEYIVVRLMANPADSLTMSGTLYFEELA